MISQGIFLFLFLFFLKKKGKKEKARRHVKVGFIIYVSVSWIRDVLESLSCRHTVVFYTGKNHMSIFSYRVLFFRMKYIVFHFSK